MTIFLLQTKVIFEAYKTFEAWVETHLKTGIVCLHSDHGGEYMLKELIAYLDEGGTACKLAVHDTPKENGVSECLNHTLMEKVRAMLWAAGLPCDLWGEAVLHAAYLKNRTSTKVLNGCTPYEAVNGRLPNLCGLPEWGCKVWVHNDKTGKVGMRAKEGHWVGYDENSNGHWIYWPDKQSVGIEQSVKFSKTYMPVPHVNDMVLKGRSLLSPP